MKNNFVWCCLFSITFLCTCCVSRSNSDGEKGTIVDFGNLKPTNASSLMADYSYVALESPEGALFGNMNQIEIYNDKIYILDNNKSNALYVFTTDGKYITKLEGVGDGPGEFISPHSFWIDRSGFIFILDRQLNRLLKYQLSDLHFLDNIVLPAPAPLSFASIPNQDLYIYYYPLRKNDVFSGKQVIIADGAGNVVHQCYDGPPSGKILHGSATNFYLFNDRIRIYPHFSNEIYELSNDSLNCCYAFAWGDLTLPPAELFEKYTSDDIMKEVLTGENDWIRLLYVYELEEQLVVKYYIKREFYLSVWHKKTDKTMNVKSENIVDDLGMGGRFPLPVAIHQDKIIGAIYPFDVDREKVTDKRLIALLDNNPEDSNPILVFYRLN